MAKNSNDIIYNSTDWQSLKDKISTLSKKEKGDIFELFTKYFLQSHPDYSTTLKEVWLFKELTPKKKQKLKLPSNDLGIDLVAQTNNGEYWAIQCKYFENENKRLSHDYISTFGNLAFAISRKFTFGLVCTTAERFSKAYAVQSAISFCTSEVWRNLTDEQFKNIRNLAAQKPVSLIPYKPFAHQKRAVKNAVKHFRNNKESRGKLILPCGSGKSLTGFWIAQKLKARSIIVAIPSLALVRQTLNTWLREAVANEMNVDWICVCSDKSIGKQDDVTIHVQDFGIPCLTDANFISHWLKRKSSNTKVVFTTYQSGEVITNASKKAKFKFEIGIMDEAHKTVGQKGKLFSHLLYDDNVLIKKRLFMTATERRYLGSSDEIASMDNPDIYGNTFELLTFKEALEVRPAILSDYRIITIGVSQDEVKEIIERNAYIRPAKGTWNDDIEAHTLTSIIALRKAMEKFPIKHAVSFHSSIARAKSFEESQNRITEVISDFNPIDTFHVTGATPTSERSKIIEAFSASPKALITNVRCLIEGVDIRNIDCILFADPKQNTIDIVQAVGRALRVLKGKKYGYVVIPVLAEEIEGEQVINNESYKHLIQTIGALATNDERIVEYFKLKNEKGLSKRKHSEHNELVEIYGERIDLEDLKNAVELRVWKRIAKLRWRPFNEAREFVHSLGFKNWAQWRNFCNSGNRPDDIPSNPNLIYKDHGWKGNSDWLTGTIGHHYRDYKPFKEARAFVHSLEFKRLAEWRAYLKSGHKPADIPFKPERLYSGKGWKGYGDWLGSGNISNLNRKFRPFSEARKFAQSLNFINRSEWEHFCKSKKRPLDIPVAADRSYKNEGWISWGDFLGTGVVATFSREFKPFNMARAFVHSMGFKNQAEWRNYIKSGHKPVDIPSAPEHNFKGKGWINWGDWLGTKIGHRKEFHEAREFVHSLGLTNWAQWKEYCKSGEKPGDIPINPRDAYRLKGWKGLKDWLGTEKTRKFRPLDKAKEYVYSLGLKNQTEWFQYCKSGKKPSDIPSGPVRVYKDKGWSGWTDWLGKNK